MDRMELRAAIARTGKGRRELAEAMGITTRTLLNKLSGVTEFKAREIQTLARELGLDLSQVERIFFDRGVNEIH